MEGNSPYITNLVNSIIGVSVLAMPFCLKQCGIILGLGLLFGAAWLTYVSCSMLISSAFHKRRRTYEYLAFYTLGPTGKFAVELSMIGMMLGTCVAFYVVIGDLSNGILSKFIEGADPHMLRVFTIIFCALCIALPLAMMKSLAVLSYFGYFSLTFYLGFVIVVILNAVSNGLLKWDWFDKVNLWRPAGVFQCLPIFSLAYACQCQLFIVYDSLEEPSIRRVEDIVSSAIKFVTVVYMSVGFFGYTTFTDGIAGNLLVSFPSNLLLDFIKLGFAMSVVLGFPLIIFPCRQSIHTLFFGKPAGEGLQPDTYIPPFLFKSITLTIVLSTMTIAIVIPNVETILGLTGATMGSIICFIFPALIYDKVSPKGPVGFPKFVLAVGCLLLLVCTYSNLANTGQTEVVEHPIVPVDPKLQAVDLHNIAKEEVNVEEKNNEEQADKEKPDISEDKDKPKVIAEVHDDEHRHEPANPIDPDKPADSHEKSPDDLEKYDDSEKVVPKQDVEMQDAANNSPNKDSQKDEQKPLSPQDKQEDRVNNKAKDVAPAPVGKGDSPPKQVESPVHKNVAKDGVNEVPPGKEDAKDLPVHKEGGEVKGAAHQGSAKDKVGEPGIQGGDSIKQDDSRQEREVPHSPKQQDVKQEVPPQEKDDGVLQKGQENPDQKDEPPEKQLLEKIKEQHDKQQQLLIEQEQLIKKLEEHQDKKEQGGEEDQINNESPEADQKGAKSPVDQVAQQIPVQLDHLQNKIELGVGEHKDLNQKIDIQGAKPVLQNQLVVDKVVGQRGLLSEDKIEDLTLLEAKALGDAIQEHKAPDDAALKNKLLDAMHQEKAPKPLDDAMQRDEAPNDAASEIKLSNDAGVQGGAILPSNDEATDIHEDEKVNRVQRDLDEKEEDLNILKMESKETDSKIDKLSVNESKIDIKSPEDLVPSSKDEVVLEIPKVTVKTGDEIQVDEEKDIFKDCPADDIECWQAKSKTRELKSIDETYYL